MKQTTLVIIFAALGVLNINAQETDSVHYQSTEISADSIMVKLNELQHKYDYLYCEHALINSQFELNDLSQSINITSNTLFPYYYNKIFDIDLYIMYVELYNSYTNNFSAQKDKIDAVKLAVSVKILTSNFTEQELNVISSIFNAIDAAISNVESALEYFNGILESYKNLQ